MEYYVLVKQLHMSAASISLLGFLVRGYWMIRNNPWLNAKLSRVLPHIVDTILLGSAIYLVIASKMYPLSVNWVTAKVILLIVYVIAGSFALKRGKTKTIRIMALLVSILTILSIFAIAGIKPALTFLS